MSKDKRDTLELLKFELGNIEHGGYGRSVRTPWRPTSMFLDSIVCINCGDPKRSLPCDECLLTDFVPEGHKNEGVPCYFIPLDEAGETIDSLLAKSADRDRIEEAVKAWLRKAIAQLEKERARTSQQ